MSMSARLPGEKFAAAAPTEIVFDPFTPLLVSAYVVPLLQVESRPVPIASTVPPPVLAIVVPAGAPCDPEPRSTTPRVSVIVDAVVNVPAVNRTTLPAGHVSSAA